MIRLRRYVICFFSAVNLVHSINDGYLVCTPTHNIQQYCTLCRHAKKFLRLLIKFFTSTNLHYFIYSANNNCLSNTLWTRAIDIDTNTLFLHLCELQRHLLRYNRRQFTRRMIALSCELIFSVK